MVGDLSKLGNSVRVGWCGTTSLQPGGIGLWLGTCPNCAIPDVLVGWFETTSMHFQSCDMIWLGTRPNGAILYELVGLEQPRCIFNLVR